MSLSALSLPTPEDRKIVAITIYHESGQPIIYQDANAQSVMYQPTAADKNLYAKNIEVMQQERQVLRRMQAQLREILYLSAYFYVAFLLVFSLVFSRQRQRTRTERTEQ